MFAFIKRQLLRRRMRQLISAALDALYSEQADMDEVATALSAVKGGRALVGTYISIGIASRLSQPLTDSDVQDAVERLLVAEKHMGHPSFEDILDLYKELAELHWLHKYETILRGKLAYVKDEYSFEGTIYRLQRDSKQPATVEQRAQYKEICGKMADVNKQIEERELKLLKEQDIEEHHRMKEEIESQLLQNETDAIEEAEARRETEALSAMLEEKLKRVLST